MKILFDIGHPAHVHVFKNAIRDLRLRGHEITIVTKDKEVTIDLLKKFGFDYINLGKPGKGLFGKAHSLIYFDYKLYKIAQKIKPDLLIGMGSPYLGHVSRLIQKPHISFWDTENAGLLIFLTYPFANTICTPSCFLKSLGDRQVLYQGYKELAYLHPQQFTPDPSVLDELGLSKNEIFIIVRFISWAASHDVGLKGVSDPVQMVKELEKFGRVFVSSETVPDKKLEKNKLKITPEKFHSLLAFSQLYIGEGGTIATEAAILGTPAIHIESDSHGIATGCNIGNFRELRDKYGLMFFYPDEKAALNKAKEILSDPNSKLEWQKKRERLLKDKIDVTAWMIHFIENYPESFYKYKKDKQASK
jgi:uncharacterized protein